MLTPSRQVPELILLCQRPGRVATGAPFFSHLYNSTWKKIHGATRIRAQVCTKATFCPVDAVVGTQGLTIPRSLWRRPPLLHAGQLALMAHWTGGQNSALNQKSQWRRATRDYNFSTDPVNRLSRHEQTTIFKLRTGHCSIREHLKRFGIMDSALCNSKRSRTGGPLHPQGLFPPAATEKPVMAVG